MTDVGGSRHHDPGCAARNTGESKVIDERTIWTERLQTLIEEAKLRGVEFYINNDCCGCSKMTLRTGLLDREAYDDDPIVFGDDKWL